MEEMPWDGFICPVSLMIISLIINLTADSSYSSMAVLHKEGGGYRFFVEFSGASCPCYNGMK